MYWIILWMFNRGLIKDTPRIINKISSPTRNDLMVEIVKEIHLNSYIYELYGYYLILQKHS